MRKYEKGPKDDDYFRDFRVIQEIILHSRASLEAQEGKGDKMKYSDLYLSRNVFLIKVLKSAAYYP